jgi:thioredoxin-like negative regulator of GroEL
MRLNPVLDQIAAEFTGIIKVAKVNAQTEQHLAMQFDIRGVPTLMLYKNGKKLNQISGGMDKNHLMGWMRSTPGIDL